MSTCLVIGGSTFVGRAVATRLVLEKHLVYVLNRGNNPTPEGCVQLLADRNDREQLTRALKGIQFDVVFDISAYTPEHTRLAIDNLEGRTQHFIHISSASVYMNTEEYPLTEESAVGSNPIWGDYGTGKFLCERELLKSYHERNFPITIFRPFYIYGPGNNHDRETYIFRRLIQRQPIIVPGYGRPVIQFGHIDDLVDTLMQCMFQNRSFGQIYNVAEDRYTTFKGWIEACAEVVGVEPQMIFVEPNDVGYSSRQWFPFRDIHLFGSINKLKRHLCIESKINLIEGLRNTYLRLSPTILEQPIIYSEAEFEILKTAGIK